MIDADGTYYLTFGSFWKDLYQVQMKGTPTAVASGSSAYQVAYDPATTAEEGAFIFKYGSYYYLFYSKGQCCGYDSSKPAAGKEYKIMVCRSSTATGGFVDKSGVSCTNGGGTVVLESHGTVYGESKGFSLNTRRSDLTVHRAWRTRCLPRPDLRTHSLLPLR